MSDTQKILADSLALDKEYARSLRVLVDHMLQLRRGANTPARAHALHGVLLLAGEVGDNVYRFYRNEEEWTRRLAAVLDVQPHPVFLHAHVQCQRQAWDDAVVRNPDVHRRIHAHHWIGDWVRRAMSEEVK